jgi:hypothetical protein
VHQSFGVSTTVHLDSSDCGNHYTPSESSNVTVNNYRGVRTTGSQDVDLRFAGQSFRQSRSELSLDRLLFQLSRHLLFFIVSLANYLRSLELG